MATALPASAIPDGERHALRSPQKRGPKPQPMVMKVTYVAAEGWDYKRAIYPTLREWGFFDKL